MYKNIQNILEMKGKEKITVLTGYDSTMVALCDQVDVILVLKRFLAPGDE